MAYYSDIQDVKAVFFKKEIPHWELYNGRIKNRPAAERKVTNLINASDADDLDSAWHELEETLNMVSSKGGNAMLFLGPHSDPPKFAVPIRLSTKTMTRETGISVNGRATSVTGFDSVLNDKLAIYDLQRQVEDLKQSQVGGFWDQLGQRFAEQIDPNTIIGIVGSLLGKQIPNTTQVAGPMDDGEHETDEPAQLQSAVENVVGVLSQHMSSEAEISAFLNKMSKTISDNPAILQQLK